MTTLIDVHEPRDNVFTISSDGTVRAYLVGLDGRLREQHVGCALRDVNGEPPIKLGRGHLEVDE